jgi:hypothetical protein
MMCLCDKKKLMLLHKVACRLNIHDVKWIFDPKWKEHVSKHKLSKVWPWASKMNVKGILPTREDHKAFFNKVKPSTSIYIPKATKSIAIHLMSITSKIIISSLAYHGDQIIWEKHISMTYITSILWYKDASMTWNTWKCNMHMYINPPNRSSKRKNNSKLSS